MVVNKSCVAACLESVRMAVESVSGCSWNECPDQRGITVRMCVEWLSESAWNPHAACMGRFGVLIDFLSHTETDNPRKVIDMKCLAKAYAHGINHQPFAGNPFSPGIDVSEYELNAEYVRVLQQAHLPIPKL